ncbi:cytochrome-c peroxidase [Ruegeria lacuscaerulensis]|uniref:cytochrome-c peroxidase n=1 Tax=Ruegeria lacuscaerulensis TaxID=55218 RepID=UPI0014802D1F|nr:cytochrome c peroxidase [Ruegeria lacuscaerulensis]
MSKACLARASYITTRLRSSKSKKAVCTGLTAVLASVLFGSFDGQGHADPTPIEGFQAPFVFGRFTVPADNPLTEEAFELGRNLFYDPILSGDNTMSCATCHEQARGFTDGRARSVGHNGEELDFNAMALGNLLWGPQLFLWDGRSPSLEHQALQPLLNPIEMNQPLDALLDELSASAHYQEMFDAAYGEISEQAVSKALATFVRLLISADSKYDRYLRGEIKLNDQEEHGRKLFMAHPDVKTSLRGGNCIDCHSQFVTAGFAEGFDGFSNNGLDPDTDLKPGLSATTDYDGDHGKFKVPSLRNIAVTGPYMHDGRFETLREVLNHYNEGIVLSSTLSPLILEADNEVADPTQALGLQLTEVEIDAIIAFLHTLTDEAFLSNPKFSNPF